MQKTPYYSYKIGPLAKGCRQCVKGEKLVMFVTGLCPRHCYFCPISDKKYKKDVVYADEWETRNIKDIIKEAELISAKGAGFTGGDPLCRISRTLSYIRQLKKRFGKKFHIHLYTSLNLVTEKKLYQLYKAGLDEIRIHLDMENTRFWVKLAIPLQFNWDVGIEIPVIPGKEHILKKILNEVSNINKNEKNKIKFINLNELEIADNKVNKLLSMGFKTKNRLSYAVKGSEELALKLLKYIEKNNLKINAHYCTAKLKDRVQLANRIKRRAKNIKKPYDKVTNYGTLIRGAIYFSDLRPGMSYRKKLAKIISNTRLKNKLIKNLRSIKTALKKDFNVKDIEVDKTKLRILTSVKDIKKIRDKIDLNFLKNLKKDKALLKDKELFLAVVEEYPTHDQIEIDVEFL